MHLSAKPPLPVVPCLALLLAAGCGEDPGAADAPGQATLQQQLAIYDGVARPDLNVLLISLDSVRRDFLSCYGYRPKHAPDQKTTPNIDAIAAQGVIYEDWHASSSWTLPAHASIMTGQPGVIHSLDIELFALHESRPTLAAVLQKVGYATAGFHGTPSLDARFGFNRGFDEYRGCYGPSLANPANGRAILQMEVEMAVRAGDLDKATSLSKELRTRDRALTIMALSDRSADVVTDAALASIKRAEANDKPWFVFANYFDPHHDYDPPAEYVGRFDPDYDGNLHGRDYFSNPAIGTYSNDPNLRRRVRRASDRSLEHIQALYAGEIAWTDAEIGRLLDGLRGDGILDDTLVIVTSSQGCEFFEHGGIAEAGSLYEEQLRVPLILRHPSSLPAGVRVRGLGSHSDLMATVLDLLGLPLPAGLNSQSAAGLIDGSTNPDDRHVLARLVQIEPMTAVRGPRIVRHTVREVFMQGAIKILRWRRWPAAMPDLPPERAKTVNEQAATARVQDFMLKWIDLEANPDEDFKKRRSDFAADPRASRALAEFQQIYARLLAQPRPISVSMSPVALEFARSDPTFSKMVVDRQAMYTLTPPALPADEKGK